MCYFRNPPGKTAVFPENSTFVQNGTLQQVLTTYRRPIYHSKAYENKALLNAKDIVSGLVLTNGGGGGGGGGARKCGNRGSENVKIFAPPSRFVAPPPHN